MSDMYKGVGGWRGVCRVGWVGWVVCKGGQLEEGYTFH